MNSQFEQTTLAAGLVAARVTTAKVLTIKTSTLPIMVAVDGGPAAACTAGTVLPIGDGSRPVTVTFSNPASISVTVGFWFADDSIRFSPADNSANNSATYLFGNCGIALSGSGPIPDSGGTPRTVSCDASGYLSIPNSPNLKIVSTNNGHRRQYVIFSVLTGSYSLNVLDLNGNVFLTIPAGQTVQLTTDADFLVSGATGASSVSIGQCFLAQN